MISPTACHPRPVARCTRCRAVTADATRINTSCGQSHGTVPCRGILRNALRPSDWTACPECMSELRPVRCDLCRSSGWLFSGQLQTLAERDDLERQLVEVIVMANKSIRKRWPNDR